MDPVEGFKLIEKFLLTLTAAVIKEGGTVNNLTGDGFLAQFGIGLFEGSHAQHAINCAIRIRDHLRSFNQERHFGHLPTLAIGIGIQSGKVAGGKISLGEFSAFLLIGDTVNSAARIEGLTKEFSVDILASEETYLAAKDRFPFKAMPEREVKGKIEKIKTYWLSPTAKLTNI
jgi:adenylate cyclase